MLIHFLSKNLRKWKLVFSPQFLAVSFEIFNLTPKSIQRATRTYSKLTFDVIFVHQKA